MQTILIFALFVAALSYLGLAVLLPRTETRVQLMLLCTGGCMLWTLQIAWPQRRQFRGAWLICGTMAFFLACSLVSVVALAVAPPGLTGREQLPPLPILLLDLTSALAMTIFCTSAAVAKPAMRAIPTSAMSFFMIHLLW